MKPCKKYLIFAVVFFVLFLLLTFAVRTADVRPVGAQGTKVGFAALNGFALRALGGYHPICHLITNVLGVLPVAVAACFALLGLSQLVHRRSFLKVDVDIYLLGALYLITIITYVFFELCIVNYRPVDLGKGLEASYPSSHTIVSICILISAIQQIRARVNKESLRNMLVFLCKAVTALIVLGRLVSGVHWLTDIAAALLLSVAYLSAYRAAIAATVSPRH